MIHIDSFSGSAAQLPRGKRTAENVLASLRSNPRVSTFDLSENKWLCGCIAELKNSGQITEDEDEPYPWHLYLVKPAQRASQAAQGGE